MTTLVKLFIFLVLIGYTQTALAAKLRIAVASNFAATMKLLSAEFMRDSGHRVILAFGSTGKHYAQILNGAPFDAFFSADIRRPELLEKTGKIVAGSRFTYAIGKIALWSPRSNYVDNRGEILAHGDFKHLAIANPRLAPFGVAAQQVLQAHGLWNSMQARLIRGENISQAFHFVASGNAELGFVALSQVQRPHASIQGSYWQVPQSLYEPIEQQAVLIKENDAARSFLEFVKSSKARTIIESFGYDLP